MEQDWPSPKARIEVINLAHRHDRRAWMERELERHGLTAHFAPGTDARSMRAEEVMALRYDSPRGQGVSIGNIGCFLSHRQRWQNLLTRDDAALIVLEDDVRLGRGAKELLSDLRWVPTDADVVKLDLFPEWTVIGKTLATPAADRSLHLLLGRHLSSAAYVVTRQGAARMLAGAERIPDAIDHYMFNPRCIGRPPLRVLQLKPAIAVQIEYLPHAERAEDLRQSDIDPAGLKAHPGAATKPHHTLTHPFRALGRQVRATTHGWFKDTQRLRLTFT